MTEGLRERKKRQTRAAIEEAAFTLFEQKGFETTTIDEIAAAADISPRTFFRYFPTKEALVLWTADANLGRLVEHLRARPAGEAPLVALVEALLELIPKLDSGDLGRRSALIEASPTLNGRSFELSDTWAHVLARELEQRPGDLDEATGLIAGAAAHAVLLRSFRLWRWRGSAPDELASVAREVLGGLAAFGAAASETL